ncbi:hypothetical protein [Microbacterium aurantiacum]|uniref:hypothetical protein n=1 Tax=Microbacterium aurantiacum TaxID=162393 RepID=UPI000C802894|nr:hypothetical protein [Microbacterium aurantiacum]
MTATTISGEITTLLDALGEKPGAPAVDASLALFGEITEQRLNPKGGVLKKDWLTYEYRDAGTAFFFGDDELCKIVIRVRPETGWAAYPGADRLIDGITLATSREELRTLLGDPTKERRDSDQWQVGRRYLSIWYTPTARAIGSISVMLRTNGQ